MDEHQRPQKGGPADPQLIADRFEVRGLLGEGPFAKVYRVLDHGADGDVTATLKILRADAIDYDRLDARLAEHVAPLRAFEHEHVQRLLDVGQTALGLLFLCGEDAEGENLAALLARRGPLPPARVVAIARQVAAGLAAIHAAGRAHGDLKPENVLLRDRVPATEDDPWGTSALVLDHGFADLSGVRLDEGPWAPPEARAGEAPGPNAGGDVWSLAALMCALRGCDPGEAGEPEGDELLADLERVRDALAADPAERPAVAQVLEELEAWGAPEVEAGVETGIAAVPSPHPPGDSPDPDSVADGAPKTPHDPPPRPGRPSVARPQPAPHRPATSGRAGYGLAAAFGLLAITALVLWWNERSQVHAEGGDLGAARVALEEEHATEITALQAELTRERQAVERVRGELALALAAEPGLPVVDPAAAARVVELEAELEELDRTLRATAAELDDLEARGRELARERDELARERDGWRESDASWRRAAEDAEARARALEGERDGLVAELGAERDALAEARGRVQSLQHQLDLSSDPVLLANAALGRILGALETDRPGEARAGFAALTADPTLAGAELVGLAVVDGLTAAALAAERAFDATTVPTEIRALEDGAAALADARAERGGLDLDRATWVDGPRLDVALASTARTLEAASLDLSARLGSRWLELLAEEPAHEPVEVLAIADWFDDGRLVDYLAGFARSVRAEVEDAGRLDLPALLGRRHLAAWGAELDARPGLHDELAVREVLLLRFARNFHDALPGETLPPGTVYFQAPDGGAPGGWRAELEARARLLADGGPWPGAEGARSLYRVVATVGDGTQAVSWRLDEVLDVVDSGGTRTWTVRQSWYRENGGFLSERDVTIARDGRVYVEDGRSSRALDLGGDAVLEARELATEVALPADLPVTAAEVAAFRRDLDGVSVACLRIGGAGSGTWLSADWGLLRTEDSGRLSRDLVFAERP